MKSVIVFGKKYNLRDDKPKNRLHKKIIKIVNKKGCANLEEFLSDLLSIELDKIYNRILEENKIELFGNLEIEVRKSIDRKKKCIAKLKGNKMLINSEAIKLRKDVLKYIICHEIAHLLAKRHSKKYWKIVEMLYPNYKDVIENSTNIE